MSDEEIAVETDLVSLEEFLLADLDEFDDDALAHALRRVLADPDEPEDPIAAWQSFI